MNHTAYFGDAVRTFALTDAILEELQFKTGVGIGALYQRVVASQFRVADIVEIIRCGLVGGGTAPEQAQRLVDGYAKDRPFAETFPLALDILDARWSGTSAQAVQPMDTDDDFEVSPDLRHAARTGDLSAVINETLSEAGI